MDWENGYLPPRRPIKYKRIAIAVATSVLGLMGVGWADSVVPGAPNEVRPPGRPCPPPIRDFDCYRHYLLRGDNIRSVAPYVALTFDDGPRPDTTPKILETLRRYQVHATFFEIGRMISQHPKTARMVLASGSNIGNHTFTHPDMTKLDGHGVIWQLNEAASAMRRNGLPRPKMWRPPSGTTNDFVRNAALSKHYRQVLWTVDTRDWTQVSAPIICKRALEAGAGDIILMHDIMPETVKALPCVIEGLRSKGLKIGRIHLVNGQTVIDQ